MSLKKTYSFLALLVALSACVDETVITDSEPAGQFPAIQYFREVALGFEYSNAPKMVRKWTKPMRIFVGGQKNNEVLLTELKKTIQEVNQLTTDGFYMEITQDSLQSNCYVFLGSPSEFLTLFPEAAGLIRSNCGIFSVWYTNSKITKARIFVDTTRPTLYQRSTLKEELTQSLGLGNDSPLYINSIFYETPDDGGFAMEYAAIDKEVIRLLYHPEMKAGVDEDFLNFVLINIYEGESVE